VGTLARDSRYLSGVASVVAEHRSFVGSAEHISAGLAPRGLVSMDQLVSLSVSSRLQRVMDHAMFDEVVPISAVVEQDELEYRSQAVPAGSSVLRILSLEQ